MFVLQPWIEYTDWILCMHHFNVVGDKGGSNFMNLYLHLFCFHAAWPTFLSMLQVMSPIWLVFQLTHLLLPLTLARPIFG